MRIVLALCLLTSTLSAAHAQSHDGGSLVATDLSQVDEDFGFQGEFAGFSVLASEHGAWSNSGVQIVAQGGAQFLVVGYPGGLPGSGWNRRPVVRMEAHRSGSQLELANGNRLLFRGNAITVQTPQGLYAGRLSRINRYSPTLGLRAPANATVLFDGHNTDAFKNAKMTPDGLLMVGTELKELYNDFTLHLEFRLPYMPYARGQGRSNSGVYIQSRYEVQILDSFGLTGEFNECGALYRQRKPDLNMCFSPLTWQTYDIDFRAARFDNSGQKTENARISLRHNGVYIHRNLDIVAKTGAGSKEGPNPLPIKFQNHRNPVVFRNMWIIDKDSQDQAAACRPVRCVPCPPCRQRKCK